MIIRTVATASTRVQKATVAGRSKILGASSSHQRFMSSSSSSMDRYGLGGHSWKKFDPSSYSELIHAALSKEVSLLEVSGQEGGEIAMVGAIQGAIERSPELLDRKSRKLILTTRIGYREQEIKQKDDKEDTVKAEDIKKRAGDVIATEEESLSVIHNVSADYVLETMKASPLLELQEEFNIKIAFLIQNPEVQVLELLKDDPNASFEDRQAYIQQRWQHALEAMQEHAASISGVSFGVVSNGLGIPSEQKHPMHLGADLVIDAAKQYDQFSTVQLPANLLETHGWDMARKLHSAVPSLDVMAIRPLTCYPDLGTGTGHPFRLVDYNLPSLHENPLGPFEAEEEASSTTPSSSSSVQYTNEMTGPPRIYQIALQTAMSHFDAEELLEIKQERDLTMEERETLDGCKLVQSMIHDLDNDLENIRSFAAHEEELYSRIIPLLYDTFEAMDDRTSEVLSAFFAAYAVAVRYAIAKNTRKVLLQGEGAAGGGSKKNTMTSTVTYPDIPKKMTLQEYALRHMLADKAFSRVIIGASTMEDFTHQMQLMAEIGDDPLDAISKANEAEANEAAEQVDK
ncbi:unnamed protein product [Cylindrotheca closterium]|uniref:Uncharacterized protein n=1 Tax=Cylindrotheca closterium TaxID=2856 RepID=A0AAD2JKW1_9STRA|nr:unnamed protein product [Cylindrotheca closterium]